MKFEIIENNAERVRVRVTIPKRVLASDASLRVDSVDVRDFLAKEKISVEAVLQETKVDNYSVVPKLVGEWVFKKTQVKTKKKRKVNVTATTTTESESAVTRSRRRRTKKVTTTQEENKLLRTEDME